MIDINNMNKLDEDSLFITDKYVFFYANKCPFSNFYYPCSFLYDAFGECHRFFTSEQAFMWHKAMFFNDKEIAQRIRFEGNKDPMLCKKLGRQVANYVDSAWDKVRYEVFLKVNIEKFSQYPELKEFILQDKFEGKTFVEASPSDRIWGIGMPIGDPAVADEKNWKGRNLLGKCITEVRDYVKNNA